MEKQLKIYLGEVLVADARADFSNVLSKSDAQGRPIFQISDGDSKLYTLVMYDITANHLHYLANNVSISSTGTSLPGNVGVEVVKYVPPNPPKGSGDHIYVVDVYRQSASFGVIPSSDGRVFKLSDLEGYVSKNGLELVARTHFHVSFDGENSMPKDGHGSGMNIEIPKVEPLMESLGMVGAGMNLSPMLNLPPPPVFGGFGGMSGGITSSKLNLPPPPVFNGFTSQPPQSTIPTSFPPAPPAYNQKKSTPEQKDWFIKGTTLTEEQKKFCRCRLHVGVGQPAACLKENVSYEKRDGKTCYGINQVCAKSVGTTSPICSEEMDFTKVPDAELNAHANIHNIPIGKTRNETLANVMKWKQEKGK